MQVSRDVARPGETPETGVVLLIIQRTRSISKPVIGVIIREA
jgi:hypothetical protein